MPHLTQRGRRGASPRRRRGAPPIKPIDPIGPISPIKKLIEILDKSENEFPTTEFPTIGTGGRTDIPVLPGFEGGRTGTPGRRIADPATGIATGRPIIPERINIIPEAEQSELIRLEARRKRRIRRGFAATILTGPTGLSGEAPGTRRTLLGGPQTILGG